ncbi:MAG: diaminohydroxyphosphoribosylaminopyrimidine deaminase [Thermoleophilales bacterium]|nr:diaminohydroxyphosphoribosylaminopyrimidine deaminase [Thermoleophilales bacterium]
MPSDTAAERDTRHLQRALELAAEARGHTSPNPLVGAVIVKDGRTIGEGYHHRAGDPHAERMALAACSEDPAGATIYVTLEPCCHHGRTPPCTDAIVEAGIRRVVIASDDPTAHAAGRGPGILRDEGIRVDHVDGEVEEAARLLNQPFRKHARTGRPLVVFKWAMTLDGKVATASGDSKWISSEASRMRSHRWRAECDAVAVGIGTALADDPQLTARVPDVDRQPRRVVFDSTARLPLDSTLVQTANEVPTVVVVTRAADRATTQALEAAGVEIIRVQGSTDSQRIYDALEQLGERGVQSVLLEGGPRLAGAFFDAGEIDEFHAFIAPIVAGGGRARAAIAGEGVDRIGAAARATEVEVERIGDDVLITARLKEW